MTALELLTFALVSTDPVGEKCPPANKPRVGNQKACTVNSRIAQRFFLMTKVLYEEFRDTSPENVELVTRIQQREVLLLALFWQAAIEENPLLVYHPNRYLCKGWVVASPDLAMFRSTPGPGLVLDLIRPLTEIISGTYVSSIEPVFKPVADNEQVIGSIEEKWVQVLHLLVLDMCRQVPVFGQDEFPSPAQELEVQHADCAIGILQQLFTIAIQNAVPSTRSFRAVNIREDWKLVVTETDLIGPSILVIVGSPQSKD